MFWQGIKCLLRRRPVCHSTRLMYRYRWLYNACLWRFCMLMPWFLLFSDPHLLHIANDCSKSKFTLTPKHLKVLDNYLFYFSYILLFSTIHLNCVLLHFCHFLCTFRSCLCKCPDYLPLVVFLEFTALNIVVQVRNLFPLLFPPVFFHPTRRCSSPIHGYVRVQISQFRVKQLYPVFATGHALSSHRPFTPHLSIMICLVTRSFFFRILLNDWTPPGAMPEVMWCILVCGCLLSTVMV